MRLIDELTLQRELFCRIQKNAIDSGRVHFDSYKNWCLSGSEVEKAISDIFSQVKPFCPTIDPETLPIVQELRKEMERVTRERDAAVSEIESIIAYGLHLPNTCPFCKNEQCKMRGGTEPCIPKWRGIQEVQEDEQL